jgi:hypothetical protein
MKLVVHQSTAVIHATRRFVPSSSCAAVAAAAAPPLFRWQPPHSEEGRWWTSQAPPLPTSPSAPSCAASAERLWQAAGAAAWRLVTDHASAYSVMAGGDAGRPVVRDDAAGG